MKRALRVAFPYLVFAFLAAVSSGRWIQPYVDSGRELAVPWRLARGEALYREVRFFHGPLAPYLAAGVETLFGRSLPARIGFALAIALAHIELLRRLAGRVAQPGAAPLIAATAVGTAFFLPPGGCHLFPFSFDTALAVAAITGALLAASPGGDPNRERLAGGCLLVALLSRPELGLAAMAALLLESAAWPRARRLAVVPLAVAAIAYGAVSAGTPVETLRREGWLAIVGPPEAFRNVYASYAGLDRPVLRVAELALAAVVLLVFGAVLLSGAFFAGRLSERSRIAASVVAAGAVVALALTAALRLSPPASLATNLSAFPPLVRVIPPLVVLAAAARLVSRVVRRGGRGPFSTVPDGVLFVAALFAARLFLAAGYTGPYNGFLLPLPLVVSLAALFGASSAAAPSVGPALPRLVAAAVTVFLAFRVAVSIRTFRHPGWTRVATPAGTLYLTEPVAETTRRALADLSVRVPQGGTLTGFPEAGFFGYVLGLASPLPQEQFFPGHLDAAEERRTIERLRRRPPDAVLYADVLAVGHRAVAFGKDYSTELDRFVRASFEPAASYGPGAGPDPRIGDPDFFIEIRVPRGASSARR